MRGLLFKGTILALFSFCLAFPVRADWVQDGGSLNTSALYAFGPSAATDNSNTVYAVWYETDFNEWHIYVKRLQGGSWVQVGGDLVIDPSQVSFDPCIALCGAVPYVAWAESDGSTHQIRVKRWSGGAWQPVGGSLNVNPAHNAGPQPFIAAVGNTPYVAWSEDSGQSSVYVKHWNGGAWEQDGAALNHPGHTGQYPWLAVGDGSLHAAWIEDISTPSNRAYVKRLNGSDWEQLGSAVNEDMAGRGMFFGPSLAVYNGAPYVAWDQQASATETNHQIHVRHFQGGSWITDGTVLNHDVGSDALAPVVALRGGLIYVTWYEAYKIYVKQNNGIAWTFLGSSLNVDGNALAVKPQLVLAGDLPYVLWREEADLTFIYAKHWDTPPASTPLSETESFSLSVSPNPGFAGARLAYTLPGAGRVRLEVYDLTGRCVARVHDTQEAVGAHAWHWNGMRDDGGPASSGLYWIRLDTPRGVARAKLTLVR